MSLAESCQQLATDADVPLVGRSLEQARLGAALDAGSRLLFVVEEKPGAGGMRVIREYASFHRATYYAGLLDLPKAASQGYSGLHALATLLAEAGDEPEPFLLVIRGVHPMLAAEPGTDDRGRCPAVASALLTSALERSRRLRVIVCCTAAEHSAHIKGTPLEREAATIPVASLGVEETFRVLMRLAAHRWPGLPISQRAYYAAAAEAARDAMHALPGAAVALLTRVVARVLASERPEIRAADVVAEARAVDGLAQPPGRLRVFKPQVGLERVVLPAATTRQIHDLIATDQARPLLRAWGFGADLMGHASTALFFGPPGTGKSVTAEAIAHGLGRPLCRLDAAGATSKWIGESEKLIQDAFRFAAAAGAVLLLDEADGLLGRRVAAEQAADRWGNSIVNQLLLEIDRFEGVAILTTNLEAQLDPALERRLSCRVRFEMPDAEGRAAIWRALIPAKAPVGVDVDLDALGRDYALSGGLIRNAVVRAAVAAARTGGQPACITMAMLRDAAEHQLGATGSARPVGFRAHGSVVEHAIHHRIATSAPAAR
jgi:hypothetical protein